MPVKNPLNLLLLCVLSACNANVSQTEPAIDYAKEEAAIMAVIEGESKAFWDKDFTAFSGYWLQDSSARIMGWWPDGGVTVNEGWEMIGPKIKQMMEDNPTPNPSAARALRKNINIRIFKDVAWLTFDQYGFNTGDNAFDMDGRSRETRVMEKHNGQWKIAYVGWLLEKGVREKEE